MQSVFNDASLQKQFDRKGYVIIPSLINDEDIGVLTKLFKQFENEYVGPFHTSHFSEDVIYKKQVHKTVSALVFPKAATYLNHFYPLFGNLMVKNPDQNFDMDLHADWTYVDESVFCSASIWIPLIDVNAENGCLGIIEGSHKITNAIRGPQIRQSTRNHEKEWSQKYGKLLPLKAGDAIIYNHALLHYSLSNKTIQTRPALNLSVVPEASNWIHYCQPEMSGQIEMYKVADSDFYISYSHFQRPQTSNVIQTLSPDVVKYIEPKMKWFWRDRLLRKIKQQF